MLLQLDPPIPVETPKGKALAQVLIDYGPEHHLLWVCFQTETGECWTWPNRDIRAESNPTFGRLARPTTNGLPTVGIGPSGGSADPTWTTRAGTKASVTKLPTET
jgi:hypothetical protein